MLPCQLAESFFLIMFITFLYILLSNCIILFLMNPLIKYMKLTYKKMHTYVETHMKSYERCRTKTSRNDGF